jgi:putative transposase
MRNQKQKVPRKPYETDLSDAEWVLVLSLLPRPGKRGRPRQADMREVISAIMYLLKSGCTWRLLPNDFPQWEQVYYYFQKFSKDGTWKKVHDTLRSAVRVKAGKKERSTAGIIDSQSVKTPKKGGFVAMMLVKR